MEKLQAGEKYLSIKLAGHDYVIAVKNKRKTREHQPDFIGDGVGVWLRTKKDVKQESKFKEEEF